jgi:hypothetical protein
VLLCPPTTIQNANVFAETWIPVGIPTVVTGLNKFPFIAIPHDIMISRLRRIKDDFTVTESMSVVSDIGHYAIPITCTYPSARFNFWPVSHGH